MHRGKNFVKTHGGDLNRWGGGGGREREGISITWTKSVKLAASSSLTPWLQNWYSILTPSTLQYYRYSLSGLSHRFIQKQGLDRTFVECDNHMWRIGTRLLPHDINVDGGSDWIAIHRNYSHYLITSKDSFLTDLKRYYKFTLLPAEVCNRMWSDGVRGRGSFRSELGGSGLLVTSFKGTSKSGDFWDP